jgi:glutathione S-transferase
MYKLYNVKAWGSLAVHCLLEEMEVPYTNIWMTREQVRDPEFRTISPLGLIPALGLPDGRSLYESAAIATFLLAAHADKGMAPEAGSGDYGEFMSVLHFMSTEIYPTMSLAYPGNYFAETPEQDQACTAKAVARADGYWSVLEQRLAETGPWLMGEAYSALDPYCFMITLWGKPTEAAFLQRFPKVAAHANRLRQRPKLKAVLESHGVLEVGQ